MDSKRAAAKRYALRGVIRRYPEPAPDCPAVETSIFLHRAMGSASERAFTMIEMLILVTVIGIVAAVAIPQAYHAVKAYRLHADASALADQLNIARMRAASQFAPYREVIDTTTGTYWREQLCGDTSVTVDLACTSPFSALTTPDIEGGTQYSLEGNSFSSCRPASVSGSSFPGSIQADPSPCPSTIEIYFNTRGAPVDDNGGPLANGGAVIYVRNQYNLVDAVTVAIGGAVSVWNWDPASNSWMRR